MTLGGTDVTKLGREEAVLRFYERYQFNAGILLVTHAPRHDVFVVKADRSRIKIITIPVSMS